MGAGVDIPTADLEVGPGAGGVRASPPPRQAGLTLALGPPPTRGSSVGKTAPGTCGKLCPGGIPHTRGEPKEGAGWSTYGQSENHCARGFHPCADL